MNAATPLSPEEALDAMLWMFEIFIVQVSRALSKTHVSLSPLHLRVLSFCEAHPGCKQQELALAITRDKGQISRLTKELEAQNYLRRTPDPQDGRSLLLEVTPAGREACGIFHAQKASVARRLLQGIDAADLAVFATVAQKATAQGTADAGTE